MLAVSRKPNLAVRAGEGEAEQAELGRGEGNEPELGHAGTGPCGKE